MQWAPTKLELEDNQTLVIHWNDERVFRYPVKLLRDSCPCATCREQRSNPPEPTSQDMLLPVITAAEAQPLRIVQMQPVGNYAYNILFTDGHDSGIFTLEFLRTLGEAAG